MAEVTKQRWDEAQDYEKNWWLNNKEENISKAYKKGANKIEEEIKDLIKINKKTKILQIGSGPEDVINYFTKGELYGIEPLADFFKEKGLLKKSRVKVIKGVGENLPFKDNSLDVIIIINVLDHCQSPKKVLSEIKRCLKKEGILYIRTYVRPNLFLPLLRIVWKTKLSTAKGHPHLFSEKDSLKMLNKSGFLVLKTTSTKKGRIKFKSMKSPRLFIQRVIEYGYTCVCKKR